MAVLANGVQAVSEGAESVTVGGFDAGGTDYRVVALPNWPTGLWEILLTGTAFTLGCTVSAPADATLRWAVLAA